MVYAQGVQEIAHYDPKQYWAQLTVYMHQATQFHL